MRRPFLTYGMFAAGVIAFFGYAVAQVHDHGSHLDSPPPAASTDSGSANSGSGMKSMHAMHSSPKMMTEHGAEGSDPQAMGDIAMFGTMHTTFRRPLARNLLGVFVLPEMQMELTLSADQVTQLQAAKRDLLTRADNYARQINAKQAELDALFAPDTSKGGQVKMLLEQIAELRAQQHYAIYTASRKMKSLLTEDQRTHLEGMRPEELHHSAMSHLTMTEFDRAMRVLEAGL